MKATLLLSTPPLPPFLTSKLPTLASSHPSLQLNLIPRLTFTRRRRFRPDFTVHADDGDGGGIDEYELDEFDAEEFDNRKDYDVDYEEHPLAGGVSDDILMVHGGSNSKSFFESSEEWGSESVVDYRINEDEFHKFSLLHCDFFIRKPPDPDNDVYDFGEMYVTPPDTDVYYIPEVLAPMPRKVSHAYPSQFVSTFLLTSSPALLIKILPKFEQKLHFIWYKVPHWASSNLSINLGKSCLPCLIKNLSKSRFGFRVFYSKLDSGF